VIIGLHASARAPCQQRKKAMTLSILIPSYNKDLLAYSRIAQACSWATRDVEVIVRDNSGDAFKRDLLTKIKRDHCNIVSTDPCESHENFMETLKLARGDFVFFLADDDFCFDRAIAAIAMATKEIVNDHSMAGITGALVIDGSQGSAVVGYQDLDSSDAAARLSGYLNFRGPNVAVRRSLALRTFKLMDSMPFHFSFHDQIVSLLYLLGGKFFNLKRLMYLYDAGGWETRDTAQKRDLRYYTAAGLNQAINKLHWLLCGFEGAMIVLNFQLTTGCSAEQRQEMAGRWLAIMFSRFVGVDRQSFGSPFSDDADRLCKKWKSNSAHLLLDQILVDICEFVALFSKDDARRYFDFWNGLPRHMSSATE
jgi:glycosyltransferase involved in cell wall biosynthesis